MEEIPIMHGIPTIDFTWHNPDNFPVNITIPKWFFETIKSIEENKNSKVIIENIIEETKKYATRIWEHAKPDQISEKWIKDILNEEYFNLTENDFFTDEQIEAIKSSFKKINNDFQKTVSPDLEILNLYWEKWWWVTYVNLKYDASGLFIWLTGQIKKDIIDKRNYIKKLLLNKEWYEEDKVKKSIQMNKKILESFRFHYWNTLTYPYTQYLFNVFTFYLNQVAEYHKH